ncbi:hypothetical protein DPMN_098250 [Dreissena polymorpha]|uniref:Uncharacterized protein n=1 Tax=Dreissena polymorpha TaxID=45954 RepID=A0A9D4LBT5_DREPO|nr:hypothetical protein DPMN_098250 [Dreissena polymorpha]
MFKKCTDNTKGPSCNCGVSVRVGDDTYVHNQCFDGDRKQDVENRKPKIWNNGEISKGLRIVTFNDGKDTNVSALTINLNN